MKVLHLDSLFSRLLISGLVMMAVGMWLKSDPDVTEYLEIVDGDAGMKTVHGVGLAMMIIGAAIFLCGFLGCCRAFNGAGWMVLVYIVMVSILLILEITAAALAIAYQSHLGNHLKARMLSQIHNDVSEDLDDTLTFTWNIMQAKLECCGVISYFDYAGSRYTNITDTAVPPTCCFLNDIGFPDRAPEVRNYDACLREAETRMYPETEELNIDGCFENLVSWIDSKSGIIIGIGVGIALIQFLGIIFACRVRRELKASKKSTTHEDI